ncbi:MAG TPA: glycosyltransferase family 4 protein [Gemmatimonadales bacterium]|nr:glycosyltransferase family 4 protein [Gemmatimonadales bacterium]
MFVAPQPFYEDRGTPIAVRQVLLALGELGYAVDLLTYPVGSDVTIPGLRIFRGANPFGIRSVPVGLSMQKLLLDLSLAAALRAHLRSQSYSCVHAVEEMAFPAALLGRRYGVPVLYDMQSSLPEQLAGRAVFGWAPIRRVLERMERWLIDRADLIVSSAGLACRVQRAAPNALLREWHFPSAPVEARPTDVGALRERLGLPAEQPVILYSGTFEAYQGLPDLIAAIPLVRAQVPNATFVLVGADRANGLATQDDVEALVRSGALRIVERQPRAEMAAYLAMADVLVSPRAYGGNLPLKIFDYLAAGRPIVATDIPTHRTVLTEDRAVLVPPRTDALAGGILALLQDELRAARLSRAARAYADEHLGWEPFVESVAAIYDEVGGHARNARG